MFLNSPIAKAAVVVFVLFFLLALFFWLKNWFEINKFQKLKVIKKDLLLLKSPFYLNKMAEIRKLSLRNKSYNAIFISFFEKYEKLFVEELDLLFVDFLEIFEKKEQIKYFLLESEHLSTFFKKSRSLKKKIELFSDNLRLFSSWENFCLSKINEFNMLLEKIYEEIERIKITFSFNFEQFDKRFNELQQDISDFDDFVYQKNYFKTFLFFCDLENKINAFLSQTYDWIKIINIFFVFLPKKQKKLNDLVANNKLFTDINFIDNFIDYYQKESIQIESLLLNWDIKNAKNLILFLLKEIDDKIYQLENKETLLNIFKNSFETTTNYFEKIKKNILDLSHFSKNLDKKLFYQRFEEAGFDNFNNLTQKIQKNIDNLFMETQKIQKISFFKPLLVKIEKALNSLILLFEIYYKMNHFFNRESEQIEKVILTLMNLNTLFTKRQNFFLNNTYQQTLDECIDFFINFEQKKYNSTYDLNYTALLSNLQNKVFNLKINVQNTILLKKIAEFLFVKINKKRFQNLENWNKILNCEILFLKQQYKNVIEFLLEVLD